jgi:hypothetical protein
MKLSGFKLMVGIWAFVALATAGALVARQVSAQTATFQNFERKILLPPNGVSAFLVPPDSPVNCKCTVNGNLKPLHGVGEIALTVNSLAATAKPPAVISFNSTDHDGTRHTGVFCPPVASAVNAFLKDPAPAGGVSKTCGGGIGAATEFSSPIASPPNPKPAGGPHLVQCSDAPGVFIETASATNPQVLQLANHQPNLALPVRLKCDSFSIF